MANTLPYLSSSNIKFRLVCPETFNETLNLLENHLLPYEPIRVCLANFMSKINPQLDLTKTRRDYLSNTLRRSPLTIIAQDKVMNDKVIGVSIAGIARKYNKYGSKCDYYDMEIPNDEYIKNLSYEYISEYGNKCVSIELDSFAILSHQL